MHVQVETLGDAVYMVASGLPDPDPDHAGHLALVAIELLKKARELMTSSHIMTSHDISFHPRIGKC